MPTLIALARALAEGGTSSRELVENCLERIADPRGEGSRAFIMVHGERARAIADHVDRLRSLGAKLPRFAGIPIAIKDLYDEAGIVTTSGSVVLRDAPAAETDAMVVARLKAAGFIIIGRNNQTEFAYSGIGANPHHGTPLNPWDRKIGRVPGGSSSGAAVAVADGMAYSGIGSDTGGSCRVPAAFCGIVGYKPSSDSIPKDGVLPLSHSLDTVGPLANSVACCRILFEAMAGRAFSGDDTIAVAGMRFGVPNTSVLTELDPTVAEAFDAALATLSQAGAQIEHFDYPMLDDLSTALSAKGGLTASESYAWHRRQGLLERADQYDPRVVLRINRGATQTAADYLDLLEARRRLLAFDRAVSAPANGFDALLMPTTPILAPTIAEIEDDEEFFRLNTLALRNTSLFNSLDRPALSLPCQKPGTAPVGLMVVGRNGDDPRLMAIAAAIEELVS